MKKILVVLIAAALLALIAITGGSPVRGQLNQSGGGGGSIANWGGNAVATGGVNGSVGVGGLAASGASKAGNPVQVGGVFNTTQPTVTTGQAVELQSTARGAAIVATGADTFNVTVNGALPAGSALLGKVGIDQTTPGTTNAVAVTGTLPAGSNIIGKVRLEPTTSCGDTYFEQAIAAVPNATTAVTATTTCVVSMYFVNITGSAASVTVTDGQGSPVVIVATFSIPPNSDVQRTWPYGLKCVSGIKWSAGTSAAVNGTLAGWQ